MKAFADHCQISRLVMRVSDGADPSDEADASDEGKLSAPHLP